MTGILLRNGLLCDPRRRTRERGHLLLDGGLVVGRLSDEEALDAEKRGCHVIDAGPFWVTAGLIDVHTHLGLWEEGAPEEEGSGNEMTSPVTPHLRVVDAVNPADRAFSEARRAGVTTVQILPGSANVIGGQGAVVRTEGTVVDAMIRRAPSAMKAAFGENPKNVYRAQKAAPSTRMAVAATLREALLKARRYGESLQAKGKKGREGELDVKSEALLSVLSGEVPLRVHAHRADDMMTALRIADEFGLSITLEHGTEGLRIAPILAGRAIPVAYGPALSSRPKLELAELEIGDAARLVAAGVRLSLTTDHPVIPIRFILAQASEAVRAGLDADDALAALTINAAEHLGLAETLGSLDEGKRADLVLWTGDPLHYRTVAAATFIDGKVVHKDRGVQL
ncbi:amidohydrolase [Aminithiophilus ramosus]|uniref:Amidohydrolase n=2 Tax=Synergistales TaxID=649776 RepID=A0A9Q7EZX6_9BACT|nr:amidohydrolase [Aminithiophilus ramosus]QTX33401.1 amidohydrolase [Aminithiophilus ramosus]QVL36852.1 amidohydrolase [Synergistota bacterium]